MWWEQNIYTHTHTHTHTHIMSSLLPSVVHPWSTVGLWAMCTSLPYDPSHRSPGLILATHQNYLIATNLDFPLHKVPSLPSFLSSDHFIFGLTTKLLRKCQKALQYIGIWSYSLDTKLQSKWWKCIEKLRHSQHENCVVTKSIHGSKRG